VTLDDFSSRHVGGKAVRFIKCDVEGFELFVVRGAAKLIQRDRPLFWCELWAEYTARYNYTPADEFEFVHSRGDRTFIINDRDRLEETDAQRYPGRGDILAAPQEVARDHGL
jgi:hypothetical protein